MDTPQELLNTVAQVINEPTCDDAEQVAHDTEIQIQSVIQSLQEIQKEMKDEAQKTKNPTYDEQAGHMVNGEQLADFRQKWLDRLGVEK